MELRTLGRSNIEVSTICLGTMTFGQQNTEAEAHRQLDLAFSSGINFIDTAEMYPVPARAQTQGRSESFVGSWLAGRRRDDLIIATKIAGPARGMDWIRGGPRVNAEQIQSAVEGSLKRLKTDYIDLYQIHWPERNVPLFGDRYYDSRREREAESVEHQLQSLSRLVEAGKIRAIGLSNETPWGVMSFEQTAERLGLSHVVSIQNAFNLLNRRFETDGLAEVSQRTGIGLLAYSPLAFGLLTGKYAINPNSAGRMTEFPGFGQRYAKPNVHEAVQAYLELAKAYGFLPAQMAIAFILQKSFTTSVIIGATDEEQLTENIGAANCTLPDSLLRKIDEIDQRWPSPAP
ncbi:aldo/keto reductase [Thiomonas sp.]|uniref:aldo/keto reductase n=2 Tax=Pseudomonadota TaxID=1224 RepID=UPI00258526B6|nr:aldo/keto reductase [Thiomonas sp.]